MTEDRGDWAELAGFERCEPSPLAFRALAALLDTWAGDDRSAAIDRADAILSTWPDAARMAPWSWCKAASKGLVPPTWPLVRTLQFSADRLSKGAVDLARLARRAPLDRITELTIPPNSDFAELSFLYHPPDAFPALKTLRAGDKHGDGDVRALAGSPLWRTLESFEINNMADSLVHVDDASRIVPRLERSDRLRHLALRSPDLVAAWESPHPPDLRSAGVVVRSVDEARTLAARRELSGLASLSIAFRCGFDGSSSFDPSLGNIIGEDEEAADAFFEAARLDGLEELAVLSYSVGYWSREGLGRDGLDALIASGLLSRLKLLKLLKLPLGDEGVAALAPALGTRLEVLELVDVYCKGAGAVALADSPCLASLRHLDLSANRIDADSSARLAGAAMPNLQILDLSGPPVNPYYMNVGQQPILDAGASAWAEGDNARRLKRLGLRNCHLADEALSALFRSPRLRDLEELDLSHNAFTAGAIAGSVVRSPLWETLRELGLADCRLDNPAIGALTRVDRAPALRSLRLGYNSIGPDGAEALAGWPVLANVWHLDLHDNLIGDRGLIALARSPHVGRLLELDLEQDCWNSRTFTFDDEAARALASSRTFRRLEALFSGCVDEYHGTAYSPGFSKDGLNALRKANGMRPAFRASCGDFSGIGEYFENGEFDEDAKLGDQDFRKHPYTLNEREAEPGKGRMRQIPPTSRADREIPKSKPPAIRPTLPEPEEDDEDIIEGLEYLDPTPSIDVSLRLILPLEDDRRPLPGQAGKVLSDTLGSLFKAASIGHFETSGSASRQDKDGRMIDTEHSFSVGIKGDPGPAVRLIRETLWWLGASAKTKLDEYPLALAEGSTAEPARFLQLSTPEIHRWNLFGKDGHRIDRVPFTPAQREGIRKILADAGAAESSNGRAIVATGEGGRVTIFIKYLDDGPNFDRLNLLIDTLTPEISDLIYKLMHECGLMAWPMAFAATEEVAKTIDCEWPKVEVIASASTLHRWLALGPHRWWSRAADLPA